MDDATCLVLAPLISVLVSVLKTIPFVKVHPKAVTLVISGVIGTFMAAHGAPAGIDWSVLVRCVLAQFSGAVATHEVINTAQGKYTPDAQAAQAP